MKQRTIIVDGLSIAYPAPCDRYFNCLSFSNGKHWVCVCLSLSYSCSF